MKLRSNRWLKEWQEFNKEPQPEPQPKVSRMQRLREATEGFMDNVETWIDTVTGGGDAPLEQVLPWNELFDGKLRVVIPAQNEDDKNIQRLAYILWNEGYQLPKTPKPDFPDNPHQGFPIEKVMQKKRHPGGEEYEVEVDVAKLSLDKTTTKTIPKGPRKGEKIQKTRTSSISKIVNHLAERHAKEGEAPGVPADLKKWWDKNQTVLAQAGNWKPLEQLIKDPENEDVLADQSIIISRDPRDVIRMGDMELEQEMGKIGHCHQEGGMYQACAIAESKGTSPIAYLVSTRRLNNFLTDAPDGYDADVADTITKKDISDYDGQEIFSDAQRNIKGIKVINRLRLRQFLDERTGDQWAIPSLKIYPPAMKVLGWDKAVQKWAWDKQKEMYEDNYEEGDFPDIGDWVRFGGWYTDAGDTDGEVLNKFFTQSGTDPDYQAKNVDNTTEEDQGPPVIEAWDTQINETMDTYNGRFDHASLWAEVEEGDEPDQPYLYYNALMGVEFDEDLFGADVGAEFEIESLNDWRTLRAFEEDFKAEMDARSVYKYFDEFTLEIGGGYVSFRLSISPEGDFEQTPEGFDGFGEYVEREYDNDYDEIRAVFRRVLINEGYMAPLPVDKLAAVEPDDFKFWDIDVDDGGTVSIRLDTPELSDGGAPYKYRPGIFIGGLPRGMELNKIFTDWKHAGRSEEFTAAFIPKIRGLFAEAEKYAEQQLELPGMEREEDILGLLIPSRAQWRLDQTWTSDHKTARIFLQIALDIDEDVDEAGMEEIEYFIKYLDRKEALELIRDAAIETLQESIEPAQTRIQKEKKIVSLREELNTKLMQMPLKELLSLATNMNAPSAMLADAKDEASSLSRETAKALPGVFNVATTNTKQIETWIADLNVFLDRLGRGDLIAYDPETNGIADQQTEDLYYIGSFRYREAQHAAWDGIVNAPPITREEDEVSPPPFFLPQHLRGELRALRGDLKDLIPNMVNKMQDIAMTYSGDSFERVSYHTTPSNREMADARWLPRWWVPLMYKYEFLEPGMSFDEEVVATLQQKQKEKAEKAKPQKKLELKEVLLLLDKIDVLVGNQPRTEAWKRYLKK